MMQSAALVTQFVEDKQTKKHFVAEGNAARWANLTVGAGHTHNDARSQAMMSFGPNFGTTDLVSSLAHPSRDVISGVCLHPLLDIAAWRAPPGNVMPAPDTAQPEAGKPCVAATVSKLQNGKIVAKLAPGTIVGPADSTLFNDVYKSKWDGAWAHKSSTVLGNSGCGIFTPEGKLLGWHLGTSGSAVSNNLLNYFMPVAAVQPWLETVSKSSVFP